jgi:fucose 4-O-acetylase-like acetyltransferase
MLAAFQGLYFLAVQLLGVHRTFSLQAPFWILWFLLSLIWWYLLLPVVLRWPKLSTAAAVLLALAGGAVEWVDYTLSLSRTLVFLPFFVIGAAYGKRILAALPHLPAAAKPACGAVAVAAWLLLYKLRIDQGWLYGSEPFARLATPDLQGIAVRAGLLAVAAITTAGFMSLVPGRAGLLEAAGRRSLAVFVLHGFVVLSLRPYLRTILDSFGSVAASGIALLVTAVTVGIFTLPAFDAAIRKASQGIVVLVSGALERLRSRVAGHGSPDRST